VPEQPDTVQTAVRGEVTVRQEWSRFVRWGLSALFAAVIALTSWSISRTQDLIASTADAARLGAETDVLHAAAIDSNAEAVARVAATQAAVVDLVTRLDERVAAAAAEAGLVAETQRRVVELVTRIDERVETLRESGRK